MRRKVIAAMALAVVLALAVVGMAAAGPDNKNSITVGMVCDGVGPITGASIAQNSAGTFNIIEPGPGSFVVKIAFIGDQFVYVNPGFADRMDDLVRCRPVSFNGGPLPPDDPSPIYWWGILTGPN